MRIAFVDGGTYYHHATFNDPALRGYFDANVYAPDLPQADLAPFDCLYVASRQNPADLVAARPAIDAFLAAGKLVVALGECRADLWLDGVQWRPTVTNFWWWLEPDADSGLRVGDPGHGLFRRMRLADATWHRHGDLLTPPGAVSVVDTVDGRSVLYDDAATGPGRRIVATLDPCYHHGSYFMPAASRFLHHFLPWLKDGAPPT
ncbi:MULTISPECIES: hypothetical protein [Cupriavidus]|uniref:Glutamine amidotransferase domain-containing protein n=1 Tax=Cupriavidus pauculus TaxID=82633 RepID=A0A3G8H862_9BURK|nr:hypothetical protein [Cupriavidus pauculus]AZG16365.1 hypothetical protein EHF44_23540 [Cupriavidus pauculus]